MATVQLIPPASGNTSITFDGRTYSSAPGAPIPVPAFDAAVLQANGWTVAPGVPSLSPTNITALSGVADIFHVQATFQPPTSSSAISPVVFGEFVYPDGAPAITGAGHVLGTLGRIQNNNTTNPIGLAIGAEGKIDNATATSSMATAISIDANLGSNLGTITSWYGVYSDLAANNGTITAATGYGLNVENNAGAIALYFGFKFPTLAAQNFTTAVYGYYFDNNPSIAVAKWAIYVNDATAIIQTLGPIVSSGKTTTATFQLDTGTKTATAVTGAATLNKASGKITTEALTTAAGASYTLTLTNSQIAAADTVFVSLANGTNSAGLPMVGLVTPAAGSATIVVNNIHASAALNGTLVISFASMKA